MTHIYWIRKGLAEKFDVSDLTHGVDINADGSIDAAELTDRDGDGDVSPEEWKSFLGDNQQDLENLNITFKQYFRYRDTFAPDNPIHNICAVESEVIDEREVEKAYERVEGTVLRFQLQYDRFKVRSGYLHSEVDVDDVLFSHSYSVSAGSDAYDMQPQDHNVLFMQNVNEGALDCDTLSMMWIIQGHTRGLPEYFVGVPGHAFFRYDDGEGRRKNLDYTESPEDESYFRIYKTDLATAQGGSFMENVSGEDLVPRLILNRAIIRYLDGDSEGALRDIDEALRINPKLAWGWEKAGFVLGRMGRYQEALEKVDRAIALFPDYGHAYTTRGMIRYYLNDDRGALEDFRKAADLSSKLGGALAVDANRNAGMMSVVEGEVREARVHLARSIAAAWSPSGAQDGPRKKGSTLMLGGLVMLVPDSAGAGVGMRSNPRGNDSMDTRISADLGWTIYGRGEGFHVGPTFGFGYNTRVNYHQLDLSGGLELGYRGKINNLGLMGLAGYDFNVGGDSSHAPLGQGGLFQYGLRYMANMIGHSNVGASFMIQHDMNIPSHIALVPSIRFGGLF